MRSQDAVREEGVRVDWTWMAKDGELIDAKACIFCESMKSIVECVCDNSSPKPKTKLKRHFLINYGRADSSEPINGRRRLLKSKIFKKSRFQTTAKMRLPFLLRCRLFCLLCHFIFGLLSLAYLGTEKG